MSEPFKEFRAPKTPLWSRMLGDWRAWRRARKALKKKYHIATVTLHGTKVSNRQPVRAWLHLFETGDGKRSYKYEKGEFSNILDYKEYSLYHEAIIPWLHKKYNNKDIAAWAEKTKQRT